MLLFPRIETLNIFIFTPSLILTAAVLLPHVLFLKTLQHISNHHFSISFPTCRLKKKQTKLTMQYVQVDVDMYKISKVNIFILHRELPLYCALLCILLSYTRQPVISVTCQWVSLSSSPSLYSLDEIFKTFIHIIIVKCQSVVYILKTNALGKILFFLFFFLNRFYFWMSNIVLFPMLYLIFIYFYFT